MAILCHTVLPSRHQVHGASFTNYSVHLLHCTAACVFLYTYVCTMSTMLYNQCMIYHVYIRTHIPCLLCCYCACVVWSVWSGVHATWVGAWVDGYLSFVTHAMYVRICYIIINKGICIYRQFLATISDNTHFWSKVSKCDVCIWNLVIFMGTNFKITESIFT